MNDIIAASRLAEKLAVTANINVDEANTFIRLYFDTIRDTLSIGEDVTITGLGTFRLTGDAAEPLLFEPSQTLTAVVNAPFESFSPVEIPAGFNISAQSKQDEVITEINEAEDDASNLIPPAPPAGISTTDYPQPPAPPADATIDDIEATTDNSEPADTTGQNYAAKSEQVDTEPIPQFIPPIDTPYDDTDSHTVDETEEEEQSDSPSRHVHYHHHNPRNRGMLWFWIILSFILGGIVGFGAGYFLHSSLNISIIPGTPSTTIIYSNDTGQTDIESEKDMDAAPQDTINCAEDQETQTAEASRSETKKAAPTYDTVTETTFLTTLARRHYGQMEYWVYIYEANPTLGNPNTIKPGTRVLIPSRDELPLTGDHNADIAAAKRKSSEIYARYPRRR